MSKSAAVALVALLAGCSSPPTFLPFVDSCDASTRTVRDIYDQVGSEHAESSQRPGVADEPLCDGGPTGRELIEAESQVVARWCRPSDDPTDAVLTASDIDWDRGVVVLRFDRDDHTEPSVSEIADEFGIDPDHIELFRGNFVKTSGCLPP